MDKKQSDRSLFLVPDKKTTNKIDNDMDETNYDGYPDISNTVSTTECTGMMYAPPQNEAEFESYQEMFNMQIPKKKDDEKI